MAEETEIFRKTVGLSAVIPCYNEEASIPELVRRVSLVFEPIFGDDFEILLVNDGSKDGSWAEIVHQTQVSPRIRGVNLSRNYGHQIALSAGLEVCRGDLILILDADLQDPPELFPAMLALVRDGNDVVYGQRTARHGESYFKRLTAYLFYRLIGWMVDVAIPINTGDFRLMTRRVLDQLNTMPERYRFIRGMVSWIGFRQVPLSYERAPRFAGSSNYPLRKMIAFAIDAVTSFSVVPLRFASHLGMIFGIAGVAALGWVVISWSRGGVVAGWTSLAGLVLIMGSIQMMMLGVFGEYLGRMYMEAKQRPLYIIDEIRGGERPGSPVHLYEESLRNAFGGGR